MRRTHALVQVAIALMDDINGRHWGYQLSQKSGVRSGVLYPILGRMMADGWLQDGWEEPTQIAGRPPRRYYQVTEKGLAELGAVLEQARRETRFVGVPGLDKGPHAAGGLA